MKPNSIPKMNREGLIKAVHSKHPNHVFKGLTIIGIRGYYSNSMGKKGVNDRAMYDDAMFLLTDNELHAFNANCDPSAYRKGIASLVPNVYENVYKFDRHNGSKGSYPAICQRLGKVTVLRDGGKLDTGMFGINIHVGGFRTTSSLGCQTIPPDQWPRFYNTAERIFKAMHGERWQKESPTYILIDN